MERRIVYVLPVEGGLGTTWGDGLVTFRSLGLHNRLRLTAVAPSFSHLPWYADHPTDPTIAQETYMVDEVVPVVERLLPTAPRRRGLLGFSKSGWGAYSLLLRHPTLFGAACAWDSPMMKDKPDQFGMDGIFGSQANFEAYRISALVRGKADRLQGRRRLGLFGYQGFREHTRQLHDLLDELGIDHAYADGPEQPHRWDGGWMEEAVAALATMI
jgi:enterochelin esterase-like enzyme